MVGPKFFQSLGTLPGLDFRDSTGNIARKCNQFCLKFVIRKSQSSGETNQIPVKLKPMDTHWLARNFLGSISALLISEIVS